MFASRGNRSGVGVVEFHGYRSLFITMNDNYREDHSIATSNRFIIVKFGLENKIRNEMRDVFVALLVPVNIIEGT